MLVMSKLDYNHSMLQFLAIGGLTIVSAICIAALVMFTTVLM